jgi:hypothetical protein
MHYYLYNNVSNRIIIISYMYWCQYHLLPGLLCFGRCFFLIFAKKSGFQLYIVLYLLVGHFVNAKYGYNSVTTCGWGWFESGTSTCPFATLVRVVVGVAALIEVYFHIILINRKVAASFI